MLIFFYEPTFYYINRTHLWESLIFIIFLVRSVIMSEEFIKVEITSEHAALVERNKEKILKFYGMVPGKL